MYRYGALSEIIRGGTRPAVIVAHLSARLSARDASRYYFRKNARICTAQFFHCGLSEYRYRMRVPGSGKRSYSVKRGRYARPIKRRGMGAISPSGKFAVGNAQKHIDHHERLNGESCRRPPAIALLLPLVLISEPEPSQVEADA